MWNFLVHNIRFFEFQPKAIETLAYNKDNCKLALAREDHSIEIWDLRNGAYQEKVIVGAKNRSVKALLWFGDSLYSTGLNGDLTEYDLVKLTSKANYQVTSSACWCMKLSNRTNQIAVGTEDGRIALYDVRDDGLEFDRMFVQQKGRVLCLAWHEEDKQLVSGMVDLIKIWNVENGRLLQSIVVGRDHKHTTTVVWCVEFTSDFQVISGDSRGKLCFWDAKYGTLIDCIKTHRVDILTLCLNKAEDKVYASGVDPNICCVERSYRNASENKHWVKTLIRSPHTHDVRALVLAGEHVVSGGVDSYLVQLKYKLNMRTLNPPIPQMSLVSVVPSLNLVLLRYPSCLELWRLGTSEANSGEPDEPLPLKSPEMKLIRVHAKPSETIVCCAISDNAKYLAYSTNRSFRLFELANVDDPDDGKPNPTMKRVPFSLPGSQLCHNMAFIPRTSKLVLVMGNGTVQVVGVKQLQHVNTLESFHEDRIHLIAVSCDGKYLAMADHRGGVDVFDISTLQLHCSLPRQRRSQATALAFSPNECNLVVTYSNRQLVEFSMNEREITEWSRAVLTNLFPWHGKHAILGIAFDPRDDNIIIAYDSYQLAIVAKDEVLKMSGSHGQHENTQKRKANSSNRTKSGIHYFDKYKHIVHVGVAGEGQLVITEVDQMKLIESLPAMFKQKKFGT